MKALYVLTQYIENILTYGLEYYGKYYSSYRAIVTDTNDPEGLGRIKLKVNILNPREELPKWIVQENRYSGKGYGSFNIPEVGDTVFVIFEGGNPNYPLWKYGYHAKPKGEHEIPEELRNPKNHWFKTPKGFLIEFDEDTEEIRLTHYNKQQILVGKNISFIRKDSKISLGKLDNSDEPAVLGNKNEKALEDIKAILSDLTQLLTQIGTSDAAVASTFGLTYPTQIATGVIPILVKIETLSQKIEATKSKNVTLD